MCTNIYGNRYQFTDSFGTGGGKCSLSRSKSTRESSRPTSMIAPTSSQSPLCSSSAIFLQSALQCFYHHLTPDTLILPQSYLAPLPSMPIDSNQQASSSNQPTLKHYHQHLKQYYHQLMLSITEQQQLQQQHHHQPQIQTVDNGSNIKQNPLISSATAALLLNRIVCGTIDETGTNCDDLMTRSMPSESVMLQHQHHHHHHHHQTQCRTTFDNPNTFIGNRHASVDCSTNYYRNQWLNLNNCEQIDHNNGHRQHIRREEYPQNNNRKLNRSSSINGSSSGPIEYRHRHGSTPTCNQSSSFSSTSSSCLRSAKSSMLPSGDQHQHQQQKQQLGNKTSCCTNINVNRHHRRTSSDQVNVIRNNGSGSTGYVTELVAKFEQRITTTTTTATTTTAARSAAPTTAVNSNASITSIASRQPQFNENQTCSCNRMALVDHSPFTTIQPQSSIIVNNKNMVESNDQENDNCNIIRRINREQEQDDKQQIEPSPNKRLSSIKAVDKTETMTTNTLNISMDHLSPSSTKPVDTKQPNHQQEHAMESGASLLRRPTSTITHKSHHNNSSSSSTRIGIASKLKTNPKSANHIITSSINHLHNQQQQRTNQHNSICCCCCCSQSNPFLLGININELKQCVANNNGKTHCHHCHIRYHNREPRLQSASPFKSSLIKTNGTLKKMENNQNKSSSQSIIMVNKGMTNQMDTNLDILNNKPSTQVAAELNNNHQVVGDHVVIGKSKSTKLKSTSTNGTNTTTSAEGLIETSLSSDNSSGSNSDNSSTDEGIDNPEDVVLDDDDDENGSVLKIDHQQTHLHHEHHHNHHYQHHRRNRNPSGGAESTNSTIIQGSLTPTTTVSTTEAFEEDEQQVERFLNGTNIKHFNDLKTEESNLLKEIELLELEQSETEIKCRLNNQKESLQKSSNNIDNDDDDDEELLEFQRIECEIKLSELRKCLLVIQKQIENYRKKLDIEVCEDQLSINRPICSSLLFANMTDSMLEECRLDAEQQINLDDSLKEEHLAPLASADEWDTESQNTNLSLPISLTKSSTKIESDLPAAQQPTSLIKSIGSLENSNVHLSDTDDSDDETTTFELKKNLNQNGKTPPQTPIRKESLQSNNTFNINEAATLERDDFHRQSLHEELLHESIEQSLKQINSVSDEDQEQFVISPAAIKPPLPKRSSIEDSPPVDDGSNNQSSLKNGGSTSLIRRDSQYENEQNHRCDITHSRGYERIQMLNNRSAQLPVTASKMESSNNENKSHSLDDLLKSDKDNQDDVVAMKRRSAKFPTENVTQHELDTTNQPNVRKRNSESSNTINSRTSISSTSQRPLTIYLPSHSEQLNLITHLHKQGHDLTSSIVTNHLLITPFTCSGYLYKQCSGSSSKWRKRYFHFNRVRKVFVYFHDRNAFEKRRHPKRGVFFDEIQDVYVDHTRINVKKFFGSSNGSNGSNDRHQSPSRHSHHLMNTSLSASSSGNNSRSVFVVATTTMNRKFTLSTFSPELMRIWMDIIFTGANAYLQDYEFDA